MVVDNRVCSQSPIDVEITKLIKLMHLHWEVGNLVSENCLSLLVKIPVNDCRSKEIICALHDVFVKIEELSV